MSTDIQAVSDLRVKYVRGVQEDRRERQNSLVDMFEDGQQHAAVRSQTAEPHTEKNLPAVKPSCSRAFTVSLGVLYLLTLAGIITRCILLSVEKDQLQNRYNNLSNNHIQLQNRYNNLSNNHIQLQTRYNNLNSTYIQLQEELSGKWCPEGWRRFGCSCYFKSTESKSWFESRKHCQDRGADLVIINNKEEQEFVTELIVNGEFWIGLRATWKRTGHEWEWVDGSPLTQTFWTKYPTSGSYASCCDGQGKWKSGYNDKKKWICEKKIPCSQ